MAVVGWNGVGVRLSGDEQLVTDVVAALPEFFGGDLDIAATGRLRRVGDVVTLELPDDLGVSGTAGAEFHRAAASRIELIIADRLTDLVAVHAGVVAVDGRAIVLPGPSMAGKSTLVRALVAAGATYLSDEYALLDADGAVRAYPRQMTIRTPGGSERLTPTRTRDIDAPPLPVALIAALTFSSQGWRTARTTSAGAVLELIRNAVNVRRDPGASIEILARAAEPGAVLQGTRGEAGPAAAALIELVSECGH